MKRDDNYRRQLVSEPAQAELGLHPTELLASSDYTHDDLMLVAEWIRTSAGLHPVSAAAAGVGLKLLGSAMLSEENNSLFDCLRGPLREFILNLKALDTRIDA